MAAFGLTRVMVNVLYGVAPNDPAIFGAAGVALAAVVVLASWYLALRPPSSIPSFRCVMNNAGVGCTANKLPVVGVVYHEQQPTAPRFAAHHLCCDGSLTIVLASS
jgi:hypothetical protein